MPAILNRNRNKMVGGEKPATTNKWSPGFSLRTMLLTADKYGIQ